MSGNDSSSPLDAALAHVNPERRRFLGMLLTGVAAAPLLTSAVLNAENNAHFPKGQTKAMTWTKGGATANDVKHNRTGAYSTTKHGPLDYSRGKPSNGRSSNQVKGSNTQLKYSGNQIKGSNSQLKYSANQNKGANTQLKYSGNQNKGANTQLKYGGNQIKGANSRIK
jgi:hypothetical protein